MYINDKFLTSEFEDSHSHLKSMLKDTLQTIQEEIKYSRLDYYDLLDTYKAIIDFCTLYNIDTTELKIIGGHNNDNTFQALNKFYTKFMNSSNNIYENIFSKKMYTMTDNEHKTIQDKINKLREILIDTELFDEKHRERILKKLEELQKELHKKMGSYDKFLGGMFSMAHTLGLSAKEAKPFTNEVKEILDITLNAKSRGENLPESNNQIENNDVLVIEDI